jgi:hypothetical protein
MTSNFFSPLSFVAVFGSGMGKNQDPGSGINIPDPQHCSVPFYSFLFYADMLTYFKAHVLCVYPLGEDLSLD